MAQTWAVSRFLARTWRRVSVDWRGRSTVTIGLTVWMVTGWLLVAGAVDVVMPALAGPTPTGRFVAVVGQTARIQQPGIPGWLIPVDRRAYDEYNRGYLEFDDELMDHAILAFEWIAVEHYQAVRILEIDGEAHHVELLEGRNVGRS